MKRLSVGILSAAALAGLAGSTVAYGWGSSDAGTPAPVSSSRSAERPHAQVVRPGTPSGGRRACRPPTSSSGACVTDVVRTVVVPAPAAPAAAAPAAPVRPRPAAPPATTQGRLPGPAATGQPAEEPGEDHAEEPGEDHEEEHGDDDGDHDEVPGS